MEKYGPKGVGVDIVELYRFRELKFIHRVAEFILTKGERALFLAHPDKALYLASRFALKEAVIKAYPEPLSYHDIEIAKKGKKPIARLLVGGQQHPLRVSLSHSIDYAAGFAVCGA